MGLLKYSLAAIIISSSCGPVIAADDDFCTSLAKCEDGFLVCRVNKSKDNLSLTQQAVTRLQKLNLQAAVMSISSTPSCLAELSQPAALAKSEPASITVSSIDAQTQF